MESLVERGAEENRRGEVETLEKRGVDGEEVESVELYCISRYFWYREMGYAPKLDECFE